MLIPTTGATEGEGTAIGAMSAAMTEDPHEAMTVAGGGYGGGYDRAPYAERGYGGGGGGGGYERGYDRGYPEYERSPYPPASGGYGYASNLLFSKVLFEPALSMKLIMRVTCTIVT